MQPHSCVRPIRTLLFAALAAALPLQAPARPGADDLARERRLVPAAGLLISGQAGPAAKLLAAIVAADPDDVHARRLLGEANLRLQHADAALAAFAKVLAREPDSPQALYGSGVAHALRHEADAAFEYLGKARATHRIDMARITADPSLASLRDDPRFQALLPSASDFARPFVEDVRVLREWDGEAANDQFGWIARGIGDVDGDGADDFTTSAPTNGAAGNNAGRVYAYSSRSGKLLWSVDGKAEDQLGSGIESAGDTDADGVQDVIASSPAHDIAYVYSGRDGHVLLELHGEAAGDHFGNHVASAGDVDHDGHADVIVGAPNHAANGKDSGRAYVFSGKDGRRLLTLSGERAGDNFGSAVSGWSDAHGTLLIVGAPGGGSRHAGRVYVYGALQSKPKFTFDADATGAKLGYMFLSVPGDVDVDGHPDVYASDWSNTALGFSTGRVYVRSGRTGAALLTLTGQTSGEGFGTTKSVAGDVDGDGHADLIVGAWQYAGAALSGGRAYLYSGKDGSLMRTYTCRTPGDTFGFDAVALGDVDGDGTTDLLITSGWSAVKGFHSGRVFLISSGVARK